MSCAPITLNIVQTDSLPLIRVQVVDQATGIPVNLVGVSITGSIRVRAYGATTSLFDAAMTKVEDGIYGWMKVAAWPSEAWDLDPGLYEGQVTLTFGATRQTMIRIVRMKVYEKFTEPAS